MKHLVKISFLAIVVIQFLLMIKMDPNSAPSFELFIIPLLFAVFFIFNLAVRKSKSFQSYFMSEWNIFTSKFKQETLYDIPQALMIDKIAEVINHSKFKLVDVDQSKGEIMATSSMTMKSWGENIYIDLKPLGEKTAMEFCSVTMFQMTSWGKNAQNYHQLLNDIEDALII